MLDPHNRTINYLRLSLTKVCNFRCTYCLPEGAHWGKQTDFLTLTEIKHLLEALTELGVHKVRLTGGEPSLRNDFIDIVKMIRTIPGIQSLAMTTNGYILDKFATAYFDAGISSINISLDSLDESVFEQVTGSKKFSNILSGIEQCILLGFAKIKINAVLMKSVNANLQTLNSFMCFVKNRPLTVRFIELMQTADRVSFHEQQFISSHIFLQHILEQGWSECAKPIDGGPAREYQHPNYMGRIGFITPYSNVFCGQCNRIRISSLGALHTCLFSEQGISLRELIQHPDSKEALKEQIVSLMKTKQKSHYLLDGKKGKEKHFSSIGG